MTSEHAGSTRHAVVLLCASSMLLPACAPGPDTAGATRPVAPVPAAGSAAAASRPSGPSRAVATAPVGTRVHAPNHVFSGDIRPVELRGDLPEILERRTLRVLVVPNHTHFFVDGMRQRGFSVDAFDLFARRLDRALKTPARPMNVLFIPVRRDRLIDALAAGLGDVAAGNITVTNGRRRRVDFTDPLYDDVCEIVVTSPQGPRLATLDDLAGRTVHARRSSAYFESLQAFNADLESRHLPPMKIRALPDVLEDEDRLEMLNAGLIDIMLIDSHIAEFWHKVFPRLRLHPELVLRRNAHIAWAVRRDAPGLLAALDEFIGTEFRRGTAERNLVHAKYLRDIQFVTRATGGSEMARFRSLAPLFQRYGERYGLDWRLMAAQGFQESRLDQGIVSPVGAVGVMQVMPATGQELGVGDVHLVEPNVHAGLKYVSQLAQTHFDHADIAPDDRLLFAFAAYNAGPNRLRHLRAEAARLGFDPNVWFGNVEVVVARHVGRETVQYVRNIYKYYVAYVLATDEQEQRSGQRTGMR